MPLRSIKKIEPGVMKTGRKIIKKAKAKNRDKAKMEQYKTFKKKN